MKLLARLLPFYFFLTMLVACSGSQSSGSPHPGASAGQAQPEATAMDPVTTIDPGRLSPVLKMNEKRAAHTATLLQDGSVLIAGGFREEGTTEIAIASAEIYDPTTNTFTRIADMQEARSGHSAIRLPDGQVLIVGGWGVRDRLSSVELSY